MRNSVSLIFMVCVASSSLTFAQSQRHPFTVDDAATCAMLKRSRSLPMARSSSMRWCPVA